MIKTDSYYVIASKETPTKYPTDERNKFAEKGDMTLDILETYLYLDKSLAKEIFEKHGYSTEDFEIRKVNITIEVA